MTIEYRLILLGNILLQRAQRGANNRQRKPTLIGTQWEMRILIWKSCEGIVLPSHFVNTYNSSPYFAAEAHISSSNVDFLPNSVVN